jgi:CDP-diacylglycerol--glycerol-3-phosphate 3-phosphatidyltransferase
MKNPKGAKANISDRFLAATFLKLVPKRVTPNQITIFRFFTVPFIMFLLLYGKYWEGTILFMVSAFSDALDGALARTTNRITKWGIVYDPLADKLLIGITAILILPKYLGPLIVFIMVFLEMILIGLGYYYRAHGKIGIVMANWWGKSKMICQSIGVFLVLAYILWPVMGIIFVAQWMLYLAICLAVVSLITYSL